MCLPKANELYEIFLVSTIEDSAEQPKFSPRWIKLLKIAFVSYMFSVFSLLSSFSCHFDYLSRFHHPSEYRG